jgi:cold shock CspA family protein
MIRGKITSWKDDRYFGFITFETHKTGIFVHGREIALDQGEMPSVGMIVEYLHDTDRLGRQRVVNVKVIRDERPYVRRPGEGRVYQTRVMHAKQPVEFEPAALRRDRERHRNFRARREMRERAERLWSQPGADEV